MEQPMNKNYWCSPIDVLAAIIIVGGLVLLALGHDGTVSTMCLAVTAFYFGLKSKLPSDPQGQ